jgi:hypothetical protein
VGGVLHYMVACLFSAGKVLLQSVQVPKQ